MITISCPKCGKEVHIDISKAIDEFGEEYRCPYCWYQFIYAPNG